VLGTTSEAARDRSTLSLLQWGFANFVVREPVRAGAVLARLPVKDQSGHAVLVAKSSFQQVLSRSVTIRTRLSLPTQVEGPLPRGAVVGHVIVLAEGKRLATVPLVLARAIPAVSPITQAISFIGRPITLLVVLLLLGAAVATGATRRQRVRATAAGGRR
jgi:D-alanyl-D-alanine carboxypeptidase (penicillin-binding protein 5/6)